MTFLLLEYNGVNALKIEDTEYLLLVAILTFSNNVWRSIRTIETTKVKVFRISSLSLKQQRHMLCNI